MTSSIVIFSRTRALPIPCLEPYMQTVTRLIRQCNSATILYATARPRLRPLFSRSFSNSRIHIPRVSPFAHSSVSSFHHIAVGQLYSVTLSTLTRQLKDRGRILYIIGAHDGTRCLRSQLTRSSTRNDFYLAALRYTTSQRQLFTRVQSQLSTKTSYHIISASLVRTNISISFPITCHRRTKLSSIVRATKHYGHRNHHLTSRDIIRIFSARNNYTPFLQRGVTTFQTITSHRTSLGASRTIHTCFTRILYLEGNNTTHTGINGSTLSQGHVLPLRKHSTG